MSCLCFFSLSFLIILSPYLPSFFVFHVLSFHLLICQFSSNVLHYFTLLLLTNPLLLITINNMRLLLVLKQLCPLSSPDDTWTLPLSTKTIQTCLKISEFPKLCHFSLKREKNGSPFFVVVYDHSFVSPLSFLEQPQCAEDRVLPHFTQRLRSHGGKTEEKEAKWDNFNYPHILITSFSTVFHII